MPKISLKTGAWEHVQDPHYDNEEKVSFLFLSQKKCKLSTKTNKIQ